MNEYTSDNLDADLRPIAHDLDALAARERAAASPALEDRIVMATRAILSAATPAVRTHEPAIAGRVTSHRRLWLTRIAALMAFTLAAWGIYLAARPSAPSTTPIAANHSDVDSLLAAMDAVDSLAGTARELQALAAQAILLQSTIRAEYADPSEIEQENL